MKILEQIRRAPVFAAGALAVVLVLASFVSPHASGDPDGLEKIAIDQGFIDQAKPHAIADSPLADYAVAGVESEGLSTRLSGVIGVSVTLIIGLGLFGRVARRDES